ncbi:hypothetical protein PUV54_16120 [Hyphococcus flavus]|uniref:Lipoprotein n=1 Tax=Hyphococcus flavus TaxID=1866326 RepID=A0AAE9ZBD3_9PROT|nr:hypothetical protein [Hyphococcus flavus]WDI31478.1 hypothetical protein PUV54_16120 [Hyphococcus flavus]
MFKFAQRLSLLFFALLLPGCLSAHYFPVGSFTEFENERDATFFAKRYSENLSKLREPSLWKTADNTQGAEQYRLLFSTGASPVHSIRLVVVPDSSATVIIKKLNTGVRQTGNKYLDLSKRISASENEVNAFQQVLTELDFWNAQPIDPFGTQEIICLHPTFFLFEAVKSGGYKAHQETTCSYTEITTELAPLFMELAGFGPDTSDWTFWDYFNHY